MRYLLFLLALSGSAATIAVDVRGTTSTGAILHYIAPDAGACVVTASPTSPNPLGLPEVFDLDETLFPGSSSDLRSVNVINGLDRKVRIGQRKEATGSDGKQYSLAIATASSYSGTLSCDSGANTGSFQFTTKTIPLGNAGPQQQPNYDANTWNGYGFPTINYADQTVVYIDPVSGAVLKRWTGPGQDVSSGVQPTACMGGYNDPASAWTTPGNIGCSPDSAYATYSGAGGAGAKLILWPIWNGLYRPTFQQNTYTTADDMVLHINGKSSDGASGVNAFLSVDGGSHTVGTPITITLPITTATTQSVPSNFPTPMFSGWGSPQIRMDQLLNGYWGYLSSVSGSTVTWSYGQNSTGFPVTSLVPGSSILIADTDPTCPKNLCTIASVQDEHHLTITQNITSWNITSFTTLSGSISAGATTFGVGAVNGFVLMSQIYSESTYYVLQIGTDTAIHCTSLSGTTFSGCSGIASAHSSGDGVGSSTYSWPNFAIVLEPFGSGTVSIDSATTATATSNGFTNGDQGSAATYCSTSTVSVGWEANGTTPISPAIPGYTCTNQDYSGNLYWYLWIPSRGESRLISALPSVTPIPFGSDPSQFFAYNSASGKIGSCAYNYGSAHWASAPLYTSTKNSNLVCTYTLSNNVATEVATAYPNIDQTYFPIFGFASQSCANTSTAGCDFVFQFRPTQGSPAWFCTLDISIAPGPAQVTYCQNTWDTYPIRWAGSHGSPYFAGDFGGTTYQFFSAFDALNNSGGQGTGPWQMAVTGITGLTATTALTSGYRDVRTCGAIWTAEGQSA